MLTRAEGLLQCSHKNRVCLNHYSIFRKYLCQDCGKVWICECEKELALEFGANEVRYGTEYGTQKRYLVSGFAPNMCPTCRGEREEAHPRAYGTKVERYYWREIRNTYLTMVHKWLTEKNIRLEGLEFQYGGAHSRLEGLGEFEYRFPEEAKLMEKKAKKVWQKRHKEEPKYIIKEINEATFLSEVHVPERHLAAKYIQARETEKAGRWINQAGKSCSAEEIAADWYKAKGFSVRKCETSLVSILVGTFCSSIVLGHNPKSWHSYSPDFGSQEFFKRISKDFGRLITKLEREKLETLYEELLYPSLPIRIYLGVDNDEAVELGRIAIRIMPQSLILRCIEWGIRFFWGHRPGWPDLFVFNNSEFLFVEVKAPNDKLSLDQMTWFKWAIEEANIPCEIFRLKKLKTTND